MDTATSIDMSLISTLKFCIELNAQQDVPCSSMSEYVEESSHEWGRCEYRTDLCNA